MNFQVKAKTINEIHSEAEKNLKLRPGAIASMRSGRIASAGPASPVIGGFPGARPGTGGMMPGMPGARRMPGMPGMPVMDNDNWEVPRGRRGDGSGSQPGARVQPPIANKSASVNLKLLPQGTGGPMSARTSALVQGNSALAVNSSPAISVVEPAAQTPVKPVTAPLAVPPVSEKPQAQAPKVNTDELRRKTVSLLEEYFSVRLLDEALQCVKELQCPSYHPEVVKEAIAVALEKNLPSVEPVTKLLEYLLSKNVVTAQDIGTGCLLYGALLDDMAVDLPKAPNNFGEIIGALVLAKGLDFKVVKKVLERIEDGFYQKDVLNAAMRIVGSSPLGQAVTDSQGADIEACRSLIPN